VFRRGEPGYPLQVLALPSSGCGLCTPIPHANRFQKSVFGFYFSTHSFVLKPKSITKLNLLNLQNLREKFFALFLS